MKRTKLIVALFFFLALTGVTSAQGGIVLDRWNVGGGGSLANGGDVVIHSALGQAIAGSSGGGQVALESGFWAGGSGVSRLYLPLVLRNFTAYAHPCRPANHYCEDYDTFETAYGPLEPNLSYQAYPDDENDYYYFVLFNSASVTIRVTDYSGQGGQLLIRREDTSQLGRDFEVENGVLEVALDNLEPGKYYIQLYTESGHHQNALYTLVVIY
jgi:hypothetical protein